MADDQADFSKKSLAARRRAWPLAAASLIVLPAIAAGIVLTYGNAMRRVTELESALAAKTPAEVPVASSSEVLAEDAVVGGVRRAVIDGRLSVSFDVVNWSPEVFTGAVAAIAEFRRPDGVVARVASHPGIDTSGPIAQALVIAGESVKTRRWVEKTVTFAYPEGFAGAPAELRIYLATTTGRLRTFVFAASKPAEAGT